MVHAEETDSRIAFAATAVPITYASEGNLIGRRRPRHRTRHSISFVAYFARLRSCPILAGAGIDIGIEACAIECVEEARMEIPSNPPCICRTCVQRPWMQGFPSQKFARLVLMAQTMFPTGAPPSPP